MTEAISVLVVDDEPAVASTYLERIDEGMAVTTETDAAAALDRIEGSDIECVVSDYRMAGMDGLELLDAVRETHPNLPFILFTGEGGEGVASEAISAGVTDYLRKGTGSEGYELLANRIANAVESYRAERALERSERKYRSLIDAAPDAVLVADAETGAIVETNAAAETLLGRPREDIIGMDQTDLHPDGKTERYRDLFERHVETAGDDIDRFADGSDVLVARADGETVPVEIRANVVEIGGQTLIHGVFRDVSASREHEQALDEERALTEAIFEALPDPAYAVDTDGAMVRWNEAFASVVGYADAEISGMNYREFVPTEDHERISERVESVIETGESAVIESALVTNAGETIPHEFSGTRFRGGDTHGIVGVGRNVAEHRRRERVVTALHEATRRLVAAEDRRDIAASLTATVEEILGFRIAAVRFHDEDRDTLDPVSVTDATRELLGERPSYERGEGLPWRAFRAGEPVVVGAAATPDDDIPLRHRLFLPLGEHGTMTVASADEPFDDMTIRLARVLATNAAVALDRLGHERRLERQRNELETLDHINVVIQDILRGLVAAATREEMASMVCERIASSDLYAFAWMAERDAGGEFAIQTGAGIDADDVEPATADGGMAATADELSGAEVTVFEDGARPWQADTEDAGPMAAVPLSYNDVVYGVLVVAATRPDAFSERERAGFAVLGEVAGFAIDAAQNMKLLLSDTAVALELRVVDEDAFCTTLTERLGCRYVVDGVVPAADDAVLQYVTIEGSDPERVRDLAAESPAVVDCRLVSAHDDGGVFEVATRESPVNSIVNVGGTVGEYSVEDGVGNMVAEVAPETDVRAMVDAFERAHPGSELLSKRAVERPNGDASARQSVGERLTDKQRAALRAAHFAGYYEWPRRSTAEEIAASMGVSSPTLHNHLRKAQQKLLVGFLDEA